MSYIVPREEPWPRSHPIIADGPWFWAIDVHYCFRHATIMEMEYRSLRLGFNILPEDWQSVVGRCNICSSFQPLAKSTSGRTGRRINILIGSVNYDYAIFAFQRLTRYEIVQDGPAGVYMDLRTGLKRGTETNQLRNNEEAKADAILPIADGHCNEDHDRSYATIFQNRQRQNDAE
eukprot:g41196.t1